MSTGKPSPLASAEWCSVPFKDRVKTPQDELVDLLLQLPECLAIFNTLPQAEAASGDLPALHRNLCDKTDSILKRLETFYHQHAPYMNPDSEGTFDPTFTAFYHSAVVICLRYYSGASQSWSRQAPRMNIHAEMILRCTSIHRAQGVYSGGSYAMIFPLKIASMIAPSSEIRSRAQKTILEWGMERGVRDSFQIAIPFYVQQS